MTVVARDAGAAGASSDELSGLNDREYAEYVRDRFEWLTGEARAESRLAKKFRRQCKATPNNDPDAARACEISRAAEAQNEVVLREARDLMSGLQKRLGGVPPWARRADAVLHQALGRPPRGAESTATATAPKTVTSSRAAAASKTSVTTTSTTTATR